MLGVGEGHEGHNHESQWDLGSHTTAWISEDGPGRVLKGNSRIPRVVAGSFDPLLPSVSPGSKECPGLSCPFCMSHCPHQISVVPYHSWALGP